MLESSKMMPAILFEFTVLFASVLLLLEEFNQTPLTKFEFAVFAVSVLLLEYLR